MNTLKAKAIDTVHTHTHGDLKNKGITLIALVITIIILLILAGITIAQLTGSGLFGKAKLAKQKTRYANAKEIVDLKLMEIELDCIQNNDDFTIKKIAESMGKETEKEIIIERYYNGGETASIKDGVTENLIDLKGIVVSVDEYSEYKFLIGKERKIIGVLEGKITDTTSMEDFTDIKEFEENAFGSKVDPTDDMEISTDIKITLEKDILSEEDVKANHYEFATIKGKIEPKEKITKVTINGKEIEVDDTGNISIDVTENGTYKIIAYGENKTYNCATVTVKDLSENLEIRTVEELVEFQKSVNEEVRSYKDKTIKIKSDLDLKDIDWKPIGMVTKENGVAGIYQGNIDGENHTISNMNINMSDESDYRGVGFIGNLSGPGSLRNLKFDKPNVVTNKSWVGVAVGYLLAGTIDNVHILNGYVEGYDDVGGVCGVMDMAVINNCSNVSYVSGNAFIGGICGHMSNYWSTVDNSNWIDAIKYCKNEGKVEGNEQVGGLVGIAVYQTCIRCSYNLGSVVAISKAGGILGISSSEKTTVRIYNTYNLGSITASKESGGIVGSGSNATTVTCVNVTGQIDKNQLLQTLKTDLSQIEWNGKTVDIWKVTSKNNGYPILYWEN